MTIFAFNTFRDSLIVDILYCSRLIRGLRLVHRNSDLFTFFDHLYGSRDFSFYFFIVLILCDNRIMT
jgi:hypothetical protein